MGDGFYTWMLEMGYVEEVSTAWTGNNLRAAVKRLLASTTGFVTSGWDRLLAPCGVLCGLGRADTQVDGVNKRFVNSCSCGIVT